MHADEEEDDDFKPITAEELSNVAKKGKKTAENEEKEEDETESTVSDEEATGNEELDKNFVASVKQALGRVAFSSDADDDKGHESSGDDDNDEDDLVKLS
jgi:hypothetical protein